MQVKLADSAGFCFGVRRAIDILYDLPYNQKKCCTLGPIIHNKIVVNELEKIGIHAVNDIKEVNEFDTVVIRSHGVSQYTYDSLIEMNKEIVDATCPFVSKIHKIVKEKSKEGCLILIAGDEFHPEVQGIIGHSVSKCYTFKNEEEFGKIQDLILNMNNKPICLVSQTTFDATMWNKFVNILKNIYTNVEIFDTICNATSLRQSQTDELSRICDAMLIIGDKSSSNTNKLYNIAKKNCNNTFSIESVLDFDISILKDCKMIGVTAGASTPDTIIKEVLDVL